MSTIITSIIIIVFCIAIVFVFKLVNKNHAKRVKEKLISRLSYAGTKNGLSFTSQEILRNKVIGVDGINRKFVVVNENEECTVVNLGEVKNCRFQKHYDQVQYGDAGNRDVESRLASIGLLFESKNNKKNITVDFFNYMIHSLSEADALEVKAKDWETILSKMIYISEQARA